MAVAKNGPATKRLMEKSEELAEREAHKTHPMVGMLAAGYVQKDKENDFHKYRYASDEGVTRKFREVMQNNGVYVKSSKIVRCDVTQVETIDSRGSKKIQNSALIICQFTFSDSDGNEYGPYEGVGSAQDTGDKHAMKALTAARKYAISQASLISWGDDPEADSKTDEASAGGVAPKDAAPKKNPAPTVDEIEDAKRLLAEEALGGLAPLQAYWKSGEVTPHIRAYIMEVDREWWDETKKAAKEADATRAKQDKMGAS